MTDLLNPIHDEADGFDEQSDGGVESLANQEKTVLRTFDKQAVLLGFIATSFMVMLSATKYVGADSSNSYGVYALVSGILGMVVGGAQMALCRFAPDVGNGAIMMVTSAVCAIYFLLGACIMTFKGPFITFGNGYVSVFAAALCAVALFVEVLPGNHKTRVLNSIEGANDKLKGVELSKRWIALCLVASTVEMIEGAILTDLYKQTRPEDHLAAYSVAVGVISIVFCFALLVPSLSEDIKHYITIFMALWWTAALVVLTFASFTFSVLTMNGYMGTWAATIACHGLVLPYFSHMWTGNNQETGAEYDELGGGLENYDDGLGHDSIPSSYAAGTGGLL